MESKKLEDELTYKEVFGKVTNREDLKLEISTSNTFDSDEELKEFLRLCDFKNHQFFNSKEELIFMFPHMPEKKKAQKLTKILVAVYLKNGNVFCAKDKSEIFVTIKF